MNKATENINVICVVVTYNRLELLKESLEAIRRQTYPVGKVIVIDNHSTDGTEIYLKSLAGDPKTEIIRTEKNLGGAGGFSEGIKRAALSHPDWIWVMDDDTIPAADALEKVLPYVHMENIGFINSKVVWTDGNPHLMNIPAFTEDNTNKERILAGSGASANDVETISGTSFVSLFIRGSIPWEIGLPYKEFFIWCDDAEYTQRMTECGYIGIMANGSVAVHKTAANYEGSLETVPASSAWKLFYGERNGSFIRHRHKKGLSFFFSQINKLRLHAHKIKKRRLPRSEERALISSSRKGLLAGLTFNPKIEYLHEQ